jgi:hypothetical protein
MTVLIEDLARTAGYIVSEASGYRSREQIMIAGGSGILKPGAVLAKLLANRGAVTVGAAVFAGTGDGAFTPANPAYGAGVQEGDYKFQLVDEGANAGDFAVVRPDGTIDGFASVGVAYVGQVRATIADGAADFASPAVFTVPVTIAELADVGKYVPLNPAGANGSEIARAILYEGCDATDPAVDVRRTITARDTEVVAAELRYADGVTGDQKTAALASLATFGIIGR